MALSHPPGLPGSHRRLCFILRGSLRVPREVWVGTLASSDITWQSREPKLSNEGMEPQLLSWLPRNYCLLQPSPDIVPPAD